MSIVTVVLVCIGAAFLLAWVLSAVSSVVGVRRRQRIVKASSGGGSPLADLRMVLMLSLGLLLNVVALVVATAWYRLRGKPLPPLPKSDP